MAVILCIPATAENEVGDLRRMLDRGREAEQGLREQLLESQQAHAAAEATVRALEVRHWLVISSTNHTCMRKHTTVCVNAPVLLMVQQRYWAP
jgi:hypothetical protein